MKNLVIVESPSKSKTIEKYLGNDYMVVSSKGHIRDLATTGKGGLGIDVEHDFEPTYKISADKRSVVTVSYTHLDVYKRQAMDISHILISVAIRMIYEHYNHLQKDIKNCMVTIQKWK